MVVSPHLDDAVLSCSHLLALATVAVVVTVFAGRPTHYPRRPTAWDRRCGFVAGEDVVATRRREDQDALAELGVQGRFLHHVDPQYGRVRVRGTRRPAASIGREIDSWRPTSVVVPLGIEHPDHLAVHRASLRARRDRRAPAWVAYADFPYWRTPGRLDERLTSLQRGGLAADPAGVPADVDAKARAASRYVSQLRGLEIGNDVSAIGAVPEHYWVLTDRPGSVR